MTYPLNHRFEFAALIAAQAKAELRAAVKREAERAQQLQAESDTYYRLGLLCEGARVGVQALDAFDSLARLARKLENVESSQC